MKKKTNNETGALLISIIIIMTLVGILGSSMAYLTQNETYALKLTNSIEQSYYLSESGLRFAMIKRQTMAKDELKEKYEKGKPKIYIPQEVSTRPNEYSLAGYFQLTFDGDDDDDDINARNIRGLTTIHSVGNVDKNHFLDTRRQTNAQYIPPRTKSEQTEFNVEDFDKDKSERKWNLTESFYADSENVDGVDSIKFYSDSQKNWVLASLNWAKNESLLPDLREWQDVAMKILDYDLQIKINFYPIVKKQELKDFMAGLNFRVGKERKDFYGISFFKSSGRLAKNPPCWLAENSQNCDIILGETFRFESEDDLCNTDNYTKCLKINIPYIVFWVKTENEPFKLIAFSDLTKLPQKERFISKISSDKWMFNKWLTLALRLKEEESAGQKINIIQAFIKGQSSNSSDVFEISFDWEWSNDSSYEEISFIKAEGSGYGNPKVIKDRTLQSANLFEMEEKAPDELGFHALYDNRVSPTYNKYDIYFDDFGMKCQGVCPEEPKQTFVQF
ncbi:conserved hypothetical protein, secreted [Candidatus Magnetomorum sp. HK-1]|nr:conserved hypothetical protein, secreted [Candidatus Magnetomorum sp. HK-1]